MTKLIVTLGLLLLLIQSVYAFEGKWICRDGVLGNSKVTNCYYFENNGCQEDNLACLKGEEFSFRGYNLGGYLSDFSPFTFIRKWL